MAMYNLHTYIGEMGKKYRLLVIYLLGKLRFFRCVFDGFNYTNIQLRSRYV